MRSIKNKQKIILGGVALIATIGSSFGFRAANFRTKRVAGLTISHRRVCKFCASLWTNVNGGAHKVLCKSAAGATLIQPRADFTWATNVHNCAPLVTKVTTTF